MTYLDSTINMYVAGHAPPYLVSVSAWVSMIGDTGLVAGLGIGIAIVYAIRKRLQSASIMFFSVAVTTGAVLVLKHIFERARPDNAIQFLTDYSFPSGHAAMAAAFLLALLYMLWPGLATRARRVSFAAVAILIVATIGISRLILNVHWFSDVLGGWSLGTLCAAIVILVCRRYIAFSK